jgi:hypothetical protein
MKRTMLGAAFFWAVFSQAQAENIPVVVELFTSQGCSSCPPADDMMAMLAAREDVIALSLHVDYWDYIGWKDEFAEPGHAKRQRAYAAVAGRNSVYTPEMIVNGTSDIVGAKPMELAMVIEKHKEQAKAVSVTMRAAGEGRIAIEANALQPGLEPMDVILVRYQPTRTARITRGENAGRTIEYVNVAQDWQRVAQWDGKDSLQVEAEVQGAHPVVVLVQGQRHGPIRAAAYLVP